MTSFLKITRTLFIGLGGTGVKSLLSTKKLYIDKYGDVPPMVAFLAIDTDKGIRNTSVISRNGVEVKLSEDEICICAVHDANKIYQERSEIYDWIPQRNISYIGTTPIRTNGRFWLSFNASYIERCIENKLSEIYKSFSYDSQFYENTDYDRVECPAKVIVISSAAGATGSGMFLDILVLVARILSKRGLHGTIRPWLILPDVFRNMCPGPGSAHTYSNTYGLIKELDYLYHLHKDNKEPIDFIFDKVYYLDESIYPTCLISNYNEIGTFAHHIDEITEVIAQCMVLISNEMMIDAVEDTLHYMRFEYDIKDKKACYISAGSAEIVYDNQAIGYVVAKGIIGQVCNELCRIGSFDGLKEVCAWTISHSRAIQHHEENILTSILDKHAPFSVIISKDSDLNTVNANIFAGADADNVIAEARNNEANKLETVKGELVTKINEILNSQNGVGAAKAFLESLLDNIAICKEEMNKEKEDLQTTLACEVNWASEIAVLRRGIFNIFSKDAAEVLQTKLNDYIARKRDLLRHKLAIQFYTDFEIFASAHLERINVFKVNLDAIERKQRREITSIQRAARSHSNFQIYLHTEELNNFKLPEVSEASALFRNEHPIYELVDKSEKELNDIFSNFAKDQTSVVEAVNVSIEEKMRKMSVTHLKELFEKAKKMSSPLWSIDFQGLQNYRTELTTIFTIGVYDKSAGIIQSEFVDEFTLGYNRPTFVTTHHTDRITFSQYQCYSPAYAVNSILDYKKDYEDKYSHDTYPVAYIDEKWNQRMVLEDFDIMPKQNKIFPNWVNAIVYGFITYNESLNSYCIESEQGDSLKLGKRRDLAFEQFQLRRLDREVEARLQKMIIEKGHPGVAEVIKTVKNQLRTYVANHAQLSPVELDRIQAKDPAYQMVRFLLENEVAYLKELEF